MSGARFRRASRALQCRNGVIKRLLVIAPKRQKRARAVNDYEDGAERDHSVLGPKAPSAKDNRYNSH